MKKLGRVERAGVVLKFRSSVARDESDLPVSATSMKDHTTSVQNADPAKGHMGWLAGYCRLRLVDDQPSQNGPTAAPES
jgi:hypothetical protein